MARTNHQPGKSKSKLISFAKSLVLEQLDKNSQQLPSVFDHLANQIDSLTEQLDTQQTQLNNKTRALNRTRQELSKINKNYHELYESAPVGYLNLSRQGIILNANTKAATLLNRDRAQLIGKPLSSFVHHTSLAAYYNYITNPKTLSLENSCELKFARKRGLPFDALMEISCYRNKRGAILEILTLISDITERKEYEQALIAEMDRAQVTLHSIGDGVITTDADGIVDYMNPIAESLTGWSTENAIGNPLQHVFRVVNEKTNAPIVNAVTKCLRANHVISLDNECVLIGKSGQRFAIQNSLAPLRGRNGNVLGVVVVFSNVTEARNMAQQIAHQATHDALTGLVNRREFEKRLTNAIKSAKESNMQHCLCYLDLDQFKIVNDTAGHVAGDDLLRKLTLLLKSKIRSRDTLARHGGDEFCLLLANCPLDQAYKISNALVASVRNFHFEWDQRSFRIGVSIGLVPISSKTKSTAELMSQADIACYAAKDLGRNQVHIYQNEDNKMAQRYTEILRVADITDSIKANRFRLYCQTIQPLPPNEDEPIHYELLLRSVDANGKIELPTNFIPAAERYGMMAAVDRWVINYAFHRYMALFDLREQVNITINLSGNSLADSSLLPFVRDTLAESNMPARRVCFEITETAAISNLDQAYQFISELKKLGCQFALDDFGSGLSSFTYLKNLPVNYLKIDGSFVKDMIDDPINEAMVAAINEVGHVMGIKTIAECVENQAILQQLTRLGVDYAQGYAISPPLPIDVIASKLNRFKTAHA